MNDVRSSFGDKFRQLKRRRDIFLAGKSEAFISLTCSLCNDIMNVPVQTQCGCRFCLECIGDQVDRGVDICPHCNCGGLRRELLLRDKAVEKEMFGMSVRCLNDGCGETILFKELGNHLEYCEHEPDEFVKLKIQLDIIQRLRNSNKEFNESILKKEKAKSERILELKNVNSKNLDDINSLARKIEMITRQIESLSLEVEKCKSDEERDVGQTSRDIVCQSGQATWTIQNIRQIIEEAKLGNIQHVVSESFYLTRPGYNMSLKMYPNGDGRAKDVHLSVYFVITKGDYDNQLLWPFKSKVTISLLSSNQATADIDVHMKPDANVACYERPKSVYNLGAGEPEFVKISKIMHNTSYVHGGDLKLRISMQEDR